VPVGKVIHAILDNYATHSDPKVLDWLADHPRWVFHFTSKSASWLNAVEGFFSTISRRHIRRGVSNSDSSASASGGARVIAPTSKSLGDPSRPRSAGVSFGGALSVAALRNAE